MGARVYLPILGRFLQVDPVEGGTDNNYVYANDPVNEFDLDGRWIRKAWDNTKKAVKSSWKWIGRNVDAIGVAGAAIGLGACVVATAGFCGAVAVGTAITGGVSTVAQARYQGRSWASSIGKGLVSGGIDMLGARKFRVFGKSIGSAPRAVRWFGHGRNYRNVFRALRKAPARKRFFKNVKSTVIGYIRGRMIDFGWRW